jgi:Rieske Fe-S protein
MKPEIARNKISQSQITRRTFCNRLLLSSSGLLVASALTPDSAAHAHAQVAYPPVKIQGAETLMPSSSLYFTYPRRRDPAILVRTVDGEYHAYSQTCSHLGCSVYFDRARRRLECPCHNGAFDVQTGLVANGPPKRPLDMIVLQMRADGEVWAVGRTVGAGTVNV